MSTVKMVPEPPLVPLNGNKSAGQQPRPRFLHRLVICVLILVLTDVSAIALSLELAILMRRYLVPQVDAHLQPSTFPFAHYLLFAWLLVVPLLFFAFEGLYTRRRSLSNEVSYLFKAVALSLIAMLASLALTQLNPFVSRTTIVLTALNLLILLPIVRYWTKRILGALGPWRKRILVLGATDLTALAMRGLTSDPFLGYEIAGVLDDNPDNRGVCIGVYKGKTVSVLGNLSEAREQMERTNSRDVLIAMPDLPEEKLLALVLELQPYCDSIYVVPQLWSLPIMNLQVDGLLQQRVMMLRLSNNLAKPWNGWLKRTIDLFLGTAFTLMVLPICVVVALLVKLDSKGPALFVQERLGYRGRHFWCLKFRTMRVDRGEVFAQYLKSNPHAMDEWQKYAKLRRHDPRLTRVGGFLRRWSLDEVPQLLNVLKGEMSLVGPRPYLPNERSRIGIDLHSILSARPGMTGLWQVSGRNQLTFEDRVTLEAWYVRNWTLWLDCIVFAKTFRTVLWPQNGLPGRDSAGHDSPAPEDSMPEVVSVGSTTKASKSLHRSAGV
jgi:Undecaprenyl-phosphate galactose phosphotransferase WbaP